MRDVTRTLLAALLALGCAGPGSHEHTGHAPHARTQMTQRLVPEGAGAPLFSDLGDFDREISTSSVLAQRYFSQGLLLAYGFNHAEALRSFREASRQDPRCAMCAWGQALVLGPNINKPMDPADVPTAWEASQRALALRDGASDVEQDLIGALEQRYAEQPVSDRSGLDRAYADAMQSVARRHPHDLDVQTLYAEALMDTMPWDYYQDSKTPRAATEEVVAALEHVIAADPRHPGALHLYIHAVEPSSTPQRAERAADTLGDLAPGAGHLVHMPSHIYLRIGRYHDASIANEKAAAADESYITQCRAQGFYPAAYYPHNVHFLYASAAFEGRSEVSIDAARKLSANMTPQIVSAAPVTEEFAPMELYALARFGRWEALATAPAPPADWRYGTGVWHFGRGMAAAAGGDAAVAASELEALEAVGAETSLAEITYASGSTPAQLLAIASQVLRARIAGRAGDWAEAILQLEAAARAQDALPYTEPPPWYFPVRDALGHALLQAGRATEAEAIFRKQLADTPRNGWSLHGLVASLEAQGKPSDEVRVERDAAWKRADVTLPAAVF
ncbi:MAG: hypothetical protein MK180_18645 [Rhodobacteraceae bacterium]|nr:hypothetical protein [Paracoccaceae bacterium]